MFPIMLEYSSDLLWCRETEVHIPLLLVGSLPIQHKTAQDAMKMKGVQDLYIAAII